MYYATVQVVVTATTSVAPYGIREGARKVVPSAKQVEEPTDTLELWYVPLCVD